MLSRRQVDRIGTDKAGEKILLGMLDIVVASTTKGGPTAASGTALGKEKGMWFKLNLQI